MSFPEIDPDISRCRKLGKHMALRLRPDLRSTEFQSRCRLVGTYSASYFPERPEPYRKHCGNESCRGVADWSGRSAFDTEGMPQRMLTMGFEL